MRRQNREIPDQGSLSPLENPWQRGEVPCRPPEIWSAHRQGGENIVKKHVLCTAVVMAAICGAGSSAIAQPDCMACGIVPGMDDRIVPMVQSLWSDEGK